MAKQKPISAEEVDYEVGYAKPPKSTQFKKGQSGNPNGRPKGQHNFATILTRELNRKVTINENGRRKKVTKLEAATKQLVNKVAGGDLASMRLLMQLMPGIEAAINQQDRRQINDALDQKLLADLISQFATGDDKSPGEEGK